MAQWSSINNGQIARQCPHRRRNGHFIIIQNNKHPATFCPSIVHGFKRHARAHGAITDNGNGVPNITPKISTCGKAKRSGDRRRTMSCTKGIIWALHALGETRQPTLLTQTTHLLSPTSQYFMGITLMPNIPN